MAAKKVVWSRQAIEDRLEILDYWIQRNRSTSYSKKLLSLFQDAIKFIEENPEAGRPKDVSNVTIWDGRRNPSKLKRRLRP